MSCYDVHVCGLMFVYMPMTNVVGTCIYSWMYLCSSTCMQPCACGYKPWSAFSFARLQEEDPERHCCALTPKPQESSFKGFEGLAYPCPRVYKRYSLVTQNSDTSQPISSVCTPEWSNLALCGRCPPWHPFVV